jgi:16S rRNA (guanine1516-N2)-methyltransferase
LLKPCILVLDSEFQRLGEDLASRFQVDLRFQAEPGQCYILVDTDGLSFVSHQTKPHLKLHLDFKRGRIAYRLQQGQNEPILKAFSDVPKTEVIFDATMGFAEDSVRLAKAGHKIEACEQNPFVFVLVKDAIERAEIKNVKIYQGSSQQVLSALETKPYAVYLDPMFGVEKSAKVKKEMQVLQLLTDANTNEQDLFEVAMATAVKKVVVKRAIEAKPVSNLMHKSVSTKTIRFDIYRK